MIQVAPVQKKYILIEEEEEEEQISFSSYGNNNNIKKKKDRLVLIYLLTCALCFFMVFWITIYPGSWLFGRSRIHDNFHNNIVMPIMFHQKNNSNNNNTNATYSEQQSSSEIMMMERVVGMHLITKYAGHTAIHLTHILPGAIWVGTIPFQFHPKFRKIYKVWHRRLGYVFTLCSILMSLGIFIILHRKLYYEHHYEKYNLPETKLPVKLGIIVLSLWFVFTSTIAVWYAIKKRFKLHQRWMIRHVASGIWIAIQRILLGTVYSIIYRPPVSKEIQRNAFGEAGFIAAAISLTVGEYTLSLLEEGQEQRKKEKSSPKRKKIYEMYALPLSKCS